MIGRKEVLLGQYGFDVRECDTFIHLKKASYVVLEFDKDTSLLATFEGYRVRTRVFELFLEIIRERTTK